MRKGPKTRIEAARKRVLARISQDTDRNSIYSRGMSTEGYNGGYAQALADVQLVLNGVRPNTREFWEDWE